jgi:3-hydroxyisobutyryl-CoA hydrolase
MRALQIAIWNGIVMGGGVGVSVHSPIRIATDNSVYAMPETAIGFFTDVGGSYFLSRVKDNIRLGLYLGLTGHRLKSRELVKWGVATHFVPADRLDDLRKDIVMQVKATSSDKEIEEIVRRYSDLSTKDD